MSIGQSRNLSGLLGDLIRDTGNLLRNEAQLAKAELGEKIDQAKTGLTSLVVGGAVLLVGLIYILNALVYGIAELLPENLSPWLAALLVGLAAAVGGYMLIQKGQSDLRPRGLMPERTAASLEKDKQLLEENLR